MSTTIHPEVSEKNKYWIDKHRYKGSFLFIFSARRCTKNVVF